MDFTWNLFIDLGLISAALLIATFLRAKVPLFQRFLIPNSITAGFLLLPLYNYVLPELGLGRANLQEMAYHLLSLSFICMSLRRMPKERRARRKTVFATSLAIVAQYAFQLFFLALLAVVLIHTFFPKLFLSFGILTTLGFVQGPGQAFAIGSAWEEMGLQSAGDIGLTFAAVGFLIACFGGVAMIHHGIRKGWMPPELRDRIQKQQIRTGLYPRRGERPVGSRLTSETEAIDSLTLNFILVLGTYLLTFLLLKGLGFLLPVLLGGIGVELATTFWGISFIFAALLAILVKAVMEKLKIDHITVNHTMSRISGFSVDVMVTSSIAGISLVVVSQFWLPILIFSIVGGLLTAVLVPWYCSRVFSEQRFHRTLLIFGVSTGTLSVGLALLRVVDPEFETPVSTDYAYATGITFAALIPIILAINLTVKAEITGAMVYFWSFMGIVSIYVLFVLLGLFYFMRGSAMQGDHLYWRSKTPEQG